MGKAHKRVLFAALLIGLVSIPCWWSLGVSGSGNRPGDVLLDHLSALGVPTGAYLTAQGPPTHEAAQAVGVQTTEERIKQLEEMLLSIEKTGKMAEVRSYQNKMMALELIGMVKLAVGVLIFIAVGFPVMLLILSYRRVVKFPGVSPEIADTLVAVEERQAKLVNILKEIQNEIDYVHSLSVPDLKKLIEEAEKYIQQNERDLEKTGRARISFGGPMAKPETAEKTS